MARHSSRAEQGEDAGAFELAGLAFALPLGGLGQERPDQDQRDGRDHPRNQRVTPGLVSTVDRRQIERNLRRQHIHRAHEQPAKGRERLGITEHLLALIPVREQLRQPRHGGHELDAHADEHQATKHQQLRQ